MITSKLSTDSPMDSSAELNFSLVDEEGKRKMRCCFLSSCRDMDAFCETGFCGETMQTSISVSMIVKRKSGFVGFSSIIAYIGLVAIMNQIKLEHGDAIEKKFERLDAKMRVKAPKIK